MILTHRQRGRDRDRDRKRTNRTQRKVGGMEMTSMVAFHAEQRNSFKFFLISQLIHTYVHASPRLIKIRDCTVVLARKKQRFHMGRVEAHNDAPERDRQTEVRTYRYRPGGLNGSSVCFCVRAAYL